MNNFIFVFNEIYNKFMGKYYDSSEILSYHDLTEKELKYLDIIYNSEKLTLSDFAIKSKISKPGATQIINKFIKEKYVVKTVSTIDKRVYYIELSEDMKVYFEESYKTLNKLYDECLSSLSDEEIKNLNNILIKINKNL